MKRLLLAFTLMLSSQWVFAQILLLDVRSQAEYDAGHAYGAVHIPHTEVSTKAPSLLKDKNQTIKVYCKSGGRAGKAKQALEALGYTNVENVRTLKKAKQYEPQ